MKTFLGDTLPARYVAVEYRPYFREHIDRDGDETTYAGIVKATTLNVPPLMKVAICMAIATLSLALWIVLPTILAVPVTLILGLFLGRKVVAGNLGKERIDTAQLGRNFVSEVQGCVEVFQRLRVASTLTPEGSGIRARTDQYGLMIMKIMYQLASLKEANEIVGGKSGHFYASTTEIKNQLENLKQTGYSLVEMTAQRRIDSVVEDMQYVGIQEFTDQVSEEIMTYRALGQGNSE